jgi:peptidoglycan/LPS O-acetylase OafA/YrhL
MMTGFRGAVGTASALFLALAALAWVLIPFAHPVYVVTALPYLLGGILLAIWRLNRRKPEALTVRPYAPPRASHRPDR